MTGKVNTIVLFANTVWEMVFAQAVGKQGIECLVPTAEGDATSITVIS